MKKITPKYFSLNPEEGLTIIQSDQSQAMFQQIQFPSTRGCKTINPNSIIYLKSDSNYTHVYFADGGSQLYSKTMKVLNSYLPQLDFIRIHHSYVVNKLYISSINKNELLVNENISLPISRRQRKLIGSIS